MTDEIVFKLSRDEAVMVCASLTKFSRLPEINRNDPNFFIILDAMAAVTEQCEAQGFDAEAHCVRRHAEDKARRPRR